MTVNIHGDLDAGMPPLLREVLQGRMVLIELDSRIPADSSGTGSLTPVCARKMYTFQKEALPTKRRSESFPGERRKRGSCEPSSVNQKPRHARGVHGCKGHFRYVYNFYVLTPTALNAERAVNFLQDSATILVKTRPVASAGKELSRNAGRRGVADGRCPDHSRPETAA
jgi:hypothetical protein